MPYKSHEKRKQVWRNQYKNHPIKRMIKNLRRKEYYCGITTADIIHLAKKQKLICPLTGRKLTNENISVDHIIPKSKGGKTEIGNLRLVTKEINFAKHCLSDTELIELCRDVVKTTLPQEGLDFIQGSGIMPP